MTKIAVIFPFDAPFSSKFGGAASRWVYEVLCKTEYNDNTQITILVPGPKTKEPFVLKHQNIKYLSSLARFFYRILPLSDYQKDKIASYFWCLSVALNAKKFDAILIENRLYYAIMLRKFGYRGKIYVHLHNELFKEINEDYLKKIELSVDGLISCCHEVLKPLKKMNSKLLNNAQVIYNGVNTDFFKPELKEKKENVILFVGRIVEQKGLHLLLDVYKKLLDFYPDLILKLAGSATFGGERPLTKYEEEIKNTVERINRKGGNIQLLGFIDHDNELPLLYNEATLVCMSSLYTEAFPLVSLEAMFCGTVVIAPILGGIPEAFCQSELLYEEANSEELFEKINFVLQNKEKRKKIESDNFNFAKNNFTWSKIAEDFKDIIQKF